MSEFTVGTLCRNQEAARVAERLQEIGPTYRQRELNPQWTAFLLEDEWLTLSETDGTLLVLSAIAPLLHFYSAEDHGWGYRILHKGEIQAVFECNYDLGFNMAMALGQERDPDWEPFASVEPEEQARIDSLLEEVLASPEYEEAYLEQFKDRNVSAFRLFDLDADRIARLEEVLQPTLPANPDHWEQVNRFRDLLGIPEMSWLNYEWAGDR